MTDQTTKPRRQNRVKKTPEQRQQERRDRFIRLAAKRVQRALDALTNVSRLGNRSAYSYTDEEAAKIVNTIYDSAVSVKDAFSETKGGKTVFTL